MWVSWSDVRTASSIPWRVTLEMPADSGAILSGATLSMVTAFPPTKIGQKENRGAYSSVSFFALHS